MLQTQRQSFRFEWKSYGGEDASNRIHCSGHQVESNDNICYALNESKCPKSGRSSGGYEHLFPIGYCEEDQSIIISRDSFAISCGDMIVRALRCPDEQSEGPWNIIVKQFKKDKCATRLRPEDSSECLGISLFLNDCFRVLTQDSDRTVIKVCNIYALRSCR